MNIEIKDGIVTNDEEPIGTIEGTTCTLEMSVGPAVKGAINKAFGGKLTFVVGGESEDGPEGAEEIPEPEPKPLTLAAKIAAGLVTPPPQHPAMGDKDPSFVDWYRQNATPEEFNRQYSAGRKLPSMTEFSEGEKKQQGKLAGEKADKGN